MDLLPDSSAIDSNRRAVAGAGTPKLQWLRAAGDDSARQRNSGQRRRLRKQSDASEVISYAPVSALCGFSGGTELDWDWD